MKRVLYLFLFFCTLAFSKSYIVWSDELLEKLQANDSVAYWYVWGAVDSITTNSNNLCITDSVKSTDIIDIVKAYLIKQKINDQQMFPAQPATHNITMAIFDAYKCKN